MYLIPSVKVEFLEELENKLEDVETTIRAENMHTQHYCIISVMEEYWEFTISQKSGKF